MVNRLSLSSHACESGRIGVFDSGVGGLTVLEELYRQLPNESILYFGDTARLPYGHRSLAEILQFVREILTWMMAQGVKMAIMACNTSSALALEIVQSEFPFPILGIVLPGARAAVKVGRRIGVIATPTTVASNAYRRAVLEVDPTAQVWQVGCAEFVPLVEQNRIYDPHTQAVALEYLTPLLEQEIDTLIYGCTHYPHLAPIFRTLLPKEITLIDPAVHMAAAAARELNLLGLKNSSPALFTQFYVSGNPRQFSQRSTQWLGYTPTVEKIQLPKCEPNRPTYLKSMD